MNPLLPLLLLSTMLFAIGFAAVVVRRNAILVLMGVEIMLNAANLNFIGFWRYAPHQDPTSGVIFVIFSIAVAAAEAAVGLALVIAMFRHYRTVNVDAADSLKG